MELPNEIPDMPVAALAKLLFSAGEKLRGQNLRRSSWRTIATAVCGRSGQSRSIIWSRLLAAVDREDALRVLRIARKHSERRKPSGGRVKKRHEPNQRHQIVLSLPQFAEEIDSCWNCYDPSGVEYDDDLDKFSDEYLCYIEEKTADTESIPPLLEALGVQAALRRLLVLPLLAAPAFEPYVAIDLENQKQFEQHTESREYSLPPLELRIHEFFTSLRDFRAMGKLLELIKERPKADFEALDSYSVTGAHGARMILDSEGQAVVVQLKDGCE